MSKINTTRVSSQEGVGDSQIPQYSLAMIIFMFAFVQLIPAVFGAG